VSRKGASGKRKLQSVERREVKGQLDTAVHRKGEKEVSMAAVRGERKIRKKVKDSKEKLKSRAVLKVRRHILR